MLCRHTIELLKDASELPRCLIPREELANWAHANQLISRAKAQADELVIQAEKRCEMLLEKASLDFWQRADAQLKRWERDRQAMCDNLEVYPYRSFSSARWQLTSIHASPDRRPAKKTQTFHSQARTQSGRCG